MASYQLPRILLTSGSVCGAPKLLQREYCDRSGFVSGGRRSCGAAARREPRPPTWAALTPRKRNRLLSFLRITVSRAHF